jgi:F-type H+-transporting ATPase subunit epsilon
MSAQFHLEIITPTQVYDLGDVDYVRASGVDGSFGVMAGHTDSIMALALGEIKVVKGSEESIYAATQGFAEITKGSVQLLVETAEPKAGIDQARAQEAYDRAKQLLSKKQDKTIDEARAEIALKRAINRLKVSGK